MICLRELRESDVAQIRQWPTYPGDMEQMDYALREQGWLEEFRLRPDVVIYAAMDGEDLIGFSILAKTGVAEAEFRIALRADKIGRGAGKTISSLTLQKGFEALGVSRIHLIVRKNNERGIRLYRHLGFTVCGECQKEILGALLDFMMMEIVNSQFVHDREKEKGEISEGVIITADKGRLCPFLAPINGSFCARRR